MEPLLEIDKINFSYELQPVLKEISFRVRPREFIAVIGPNGSGKSTLLKCLFGLYPIKSGNILSEGNPIKNLSRRSIAQKMTLLPQDTSVEFPFTVREVVSMGRNPYHGRFQTETENDGAIIDRAMSMTDTLTLSDRPITALSGGERQRALLARAVAQETSLLLLDEPTANLDMVHQLETLQLARNLVEGGKSVVMALHDLTLASRYANRILLLFQGKIVAEGTPEQVINEQSLSLYFDVKARVERDPNTKTMGLIVTPIEPMRRRF